MDLQMPELDGVEAAKRIREHERRLMMRRPAFIAALTANGLLAERERCLEAGMNAYITKPINRSVLVEILIRASEFRHYAFRAI